MSKKQSKKRKEQTKLSKILSSSSEKRIVMSNFFHKLNENEIRLSVPNLLQHRHFKKSLFIGNFGFDSIYNISSPKASLYKNIHWCLGIIAAHKNIIDTFLYKKEAILQLILKNDFNQALNHLDDLDAACGDSIWSISIRGTLLTLEKSIEEKNDYLNTLNTKSKKNKFLKATVSLVANRHSDNSTLPAFNDFAEQKIRRSFTGELQHFLMYKIVPYSYSFDYDFEHILNIEKNTPPIDIYCVLLDMVRYSLLTSNQHNFYNESKITIKNLYKLFPVDEIMSLANGYGILTPFSFQNEEIYILDLYTSGRYQDVCDFFEQNENRNIKFSMFEIWVKSACRTKTYPNGFLGDLIQNLVSVINRDAKYEESLSQIYLMCQALQPFSWFKELHIFITKETRFISKEINSRLNTASKIISTLNSPLRGKALPSSVSIKYINELNQKYPSSLSVNLFKERIEFDSNSLASNILSTDPFRHSKYKAEMLIKEKKYDDAIIELKNLTECSDITIKNDAIKLLVSTYILADKIELAISFYIDIVMDNFSFLQVFDSQLLCEHAVHIIKDSNDISIPIALSLHSINVNSNFDPALKYSFEQFLINNNCQSPLDLLEIEEKFDKRDLYYFLKNVCTPENMKLYFYFDNPNQIEECRIKICRKLIERGQSQEVLVFEVKERTKRQVILKAAKQVDNSRIHADISTLINSSNFKKLYDAYITLSAKDYSNSHDEININTLLVKLEKIKEDEGLECFEQTLYMVHIQDIVLNEKNTIFMKLMKLVRDEFAFGIKGLNGHLSTRIRHGHLPNTIRNCFSEQDLISTKISATGGFKINNTWQDNFSYLNKSKLVSVDKEFIDFSSRLLEIINEINDKWLQIIIYDQDIAGLENNIPDRTAQFNYSTTYTECIYLQRSLTSHFNYSDFVKVIIAWLWKRTEINLKNIRTEIETSLKSKLFNLLNTLESNIFNIVGDTDGLTNFTDAIATSRRKINTNIDTIIGWFNRAKGLSIPYFDSDVAVSITKWSAGIEINNIDNTKLKFQGWSLTYFVDALYVLIDNCLTKSNITKNNLTINTLWNLTSNGLELSVTNNCMKINSLEDSNSRLNFYREAYGKEDISIKASQEEGNSGFFKIWKSIAKDLDMLHSISFGYCDDEHFNVTINIPKLELDKVIYNAHNNY
ncbi:TPA: hypothetical protein ACKRFZ_001096 [Proteus mirabilis]|uniref:hypothetical protein n=1 Tax=Proteus sp. G2609 TaxID=2698840 RepID=UPI0013773CDB|nr:hypothetical protein [Proteus sp. G2609]MBI6497177.1 hypothetical protein [Proteus mirabilis]NBN68978.1 hypothetical protein [Proteus sp. G2609]HEK0600645.1 hypothetical protein [Proteus mirabilis]HEK3141926.1 hypothetical protein [Proteus mirabilis]